MCRSLVTSSNIVRSDLPDVVIPGGQITSFIADKLGQYRGAVAMEDGITGNTITYDQLLDKVTTANNTCYDELCKLCFFTSCLANKNLNTALNFYLLS